MYAEKSRILLQAKEFICVRPHPLLGVYVANYNVTFPTKTLMSGNFTIMPCGCAAISIEKGNNKIRVNLDGPITKPYMAGTEASKLDMLVTIEFRPAGLYALTGIAQSEIIDKTIPLEGVSTAFATQITEIIHKSNTIAELVNTLDTVLLANLRTAYRPELMMALESIKESAGNISVKQLSHNTHYSQRQLNRIFNQFVGMGTKSFSRLMRINNTFQLLKKEGRSLDYISDIAGFHDLSHFIHDFSLVCGITPNEYRKNMSDFYNNPTRF